VTRIRFQSLLAMACLIALVGTRLERGLLELPFADQRPIREYFAQVPDLLWQGYPEFLQGVRERTRPGDSIAILVPARHWNEGYAYAYYRASYFLAGRRVIPLVMPDDRDAPENLGMADYLATWRKEIPTGGHAVIWRGSGGMLVRR
jgi:hypothetical protein